MALLVNTIVSTNGRYSWASVDEAISDINSLYSNNTPMWEIYKQSGDCMVNYELPAHNQIIIEVTWPSSNAAINYLSNSEIYNVKYPLLDAGFRLDWFVVTPDGQTQGGSFEPQS